MSEVIRSMQHRRFYPGDCREQLEQFLSGPSAQSVPSRDLFGAVVPHAGWRYSGAVAARTLQLLSKHSVADLVVLLGAYHRPRDQRHALAPDDAWETPFGPVALDQALARKVSDALGPAVTVDARAHTGEHSLEVVAPFVHELFPGATILPLLVYPEAAPAALGEELSRLLERRNAVVVASTDLTHYGDAYAFTPAGTGAEAQEWMRHNDERILRLVTALEAEAIPGEAARHANACGPGALAACCALMRARGVESGSLLEHTSSHEVATPDEPFRMAVGYAGLVF